MRKRNEETIIKELNEVSDVCVCATPTKIIMNGNGVVVLSLICTLVDKIKDMLPVEVVEQSLKFALMTDKDKDKELKKEIKKRDKLSKELEKKFEELFK